MKIILVGKSGAGKSTMESLLVDNYKWEKVVTTTTRPKRENEVDGVDYYFIKTDKFDDMIKNNEFVEYTEYRGWKYGTTKDELQRGRNQIFALNPYGLDQILSKYNDCISIYIDTDDRVRYIRQILRGDNIIEIALRSERDAVAFWNIENKVDFVINNNSENTWDCLHSILESIVKSEKENTDKNQNKNNIISLVK